MKHYFPPQNQTFKYLQTNRSDRMGSIFSSFNLDFQSKLGVVRLAPKLVTNTTSSDDADLGLPVAFEFWYNEWWAICGTRIFKNSASDIVTGFTEETTIAYTIGDSTTQFDVTNPSGTTFRYTYDTNGTNPGITATTFPIGSTVKISLTNLAAGNRGTFTVTGSAANYFEVTNAGGVVESNKTISTGYISVLGGTFGLDFTTTQSDLMVFNDKLWSTTASRLYYKDSDDTSTRPWFIAYTFGSALGVHKLCYFKKFDRLYFLDQSTLIGSISVSLVVASSGDYTLNPGTNISYASTIVANSQYLWIGTFRNITAGDPATNQTKASILQWDGISAQVTNEFPVEVGGVWAMCVINDVPYALDSEGRILKFTGYSFEEIQRLPIDRDLLLNATAYNVARFVHMNGMIGTKNNTILISINNVNDDANSDINENLPSGVWELDLATNSLTHKYAPTLKARSSSVVTDFGQNRISAPGALKLNTLQSASALGRGTLLAGFNYYTDATTVKSGIFIDSPTKASTDNEGQKGGYFVTVKYSAMDELGNFSVQNMWQTVYTLYRRLLDSNDKITVKFRSEEISPTYATITWTSTTTFTTTTDVSAMLGYEVEPIQGLGSGKLSHITAIVNNAGTYTVTVDETYTSATGTSKARFQNWKKINTISYSSPATYDKAGIDTLSNWIQLKIGMLFTGNNEVERLITISQDYNPAN